MTGRKEVVNMKQVESKYKVDDRLMMINDYHHMNGVVLKVNKRYPESHTYDYIVKLETGAIWYVDELQLDSVVEVVW